MKVFTVFFLMMYCRPNSWIVMAANAGCGIFTYGSPNRISGFLAVSSACIKAR